VPFSDPVPASPGWDLCTRAFGITGGAVVPYSSGCQPGPRSGDIIDRQPPPIGEQVECMSCGRSEDERLAGPCGDATKVASCLGTGVGAALGVLGGLRGLGCAVSVGGAGFSSACGGTRGPEVMYASPEAHPKKGNPLRKPQYPQPPVPADPKQPPGLGWVWKGSGPAGSKRGNWVGPGGKLRPDLDHPDPIGPHWDWTDPGGYRWRIPI
jgi:hypothetical protein